MKIRPLQDRVVVRRSEEETTTASGIVLPDSAKEKPQRGEVIAVGNGKKLDNGSVQTIDVKVGDTIVFGPYAGDKLKNGDEELLILKENEIFGIIE